MGSKFIAKIFGHENDITKEAALKKCSDHLGGTWDEISVDDFTISVIQ